MRKLSIENLISVTRGDFYGDKTLLRRDISAVTTDSRNITPDCLFAAIAGERVDGHDFIPVAWQEGALCCLGEKMPEKIEGSFIRVSDTVKALQAIATFYRCNFDIPFIGITGSVGKTTAKEMVSAVLGQKYNVLKTAGNFNNDLGVPLTIFNLREEHTAAVVEMGVSHFDDMRRLTNIVLPDYGLFTVIGHAHLEFLGDREGVLRAKSEMLEGMSTGAKIFCSGDDDLLAAADFEREKITYGLGDNCAVRAENIHHMPDGSTAFDVVAQERRFPVAVMAFGEHMISAALAGAALGMELGLSDEEIARGIASYVPVGSRARLVDTSKIKIIDDCYNSNPTSLASALRSLAAMPGRRVAIIGDMLELGKDSAGLHCQSADYAKSLGIELVLSAGEECRNMDSMHFEEKGALIAALPEIIVPGDAVLVKASRGMHFEDIVEALKNL